MGDVLQPFGDPAVEARHWLDTSSRDEIILVTISYAQLVRALEGMAPFLPSLAAYLSHARTVHAVLLENIERW